MNDRDVFNHVTNSREDILQEFLDTLHKNQIPFCVIGGLAVNAYAEPVVSLDLDLVGTTAWLEDLVAILEERFTVTRFPHRVNVSSPHSDLRIQLQTDVRYQPFVARAEPKTILGYELSVAALEDVLTGKVWAFSDPERRPSKRQKDLADIMRLVETYPRLLSSLSQSLQERVKAESNFTEFTEDKE
jgi:hypothetical protein